MMKGTIRKGSSQDAASILAVLEDVYEASPWKLEQIEADLEQESTSYFLAVDEGQVLGFVAIQESLYEAEVLQIAVKRVFQGQGLAQQLLAQLPDQKEIFLEVRVSNQPAQGLYKKMHFEEIARRKNYYHDPIEDSVLKNDDQLLSNVIASQIESHKRFGGVVPEVASRHHVEVITACIEEALEEAGITEADVTAVAVTYGPGLVGALLVGLAAAKAFAWAHGLPLIPVNHMAGHLMAAQSVEPLEFPLLALLVSGGHTELVYVSEAGDYKIVGETRDDAVGEAYDKVGRVMGLTYPAGREIDQLAHQGDDIYDFPRAMIKEDNLEFSFSGLKSAFINLHHNAQQKGESLSNADLSASFQAAVLDILMAKTKKALEKYPVKTLVVAGGVAANQGLRERLASEITDVKVIIPPLRLCGDNAGMIAYASVSEWNKENFAGWDLNAKPSLALEGVKKGATSLLDEGIQMAFLMGSHQLGFFIML